MSLQFAPGSTSVSVTVQVVDDSGLPVTGLVASTFPSVSYRRHGPYANVTLVLSDLATITTAWDGTGAVGLKEDTGGGGYYRLDLPDAIFASASTWNIKGEATGKHLICPVIEVKYADMDLVALASAFDGAEVTINNPYQNGTITLHVNADYTIALSRQIRITLAAGAYPDISSATAIRLGITKLVDNTGGFTIAYTARSGHASNAQTIDFEPQSETDTNDLDPAYDYGYTCVVSYDANTHVVVAEGNVIVKANRVV